MTIWELGEAAGPLLIAPLSEVFGRYPVMNVANGLFIGATVLAALSQSTWLFIAARALTGLAVASNVLNPAIVGDMFVSEQRGSPMSLIMMAPLIGGAVGPAIAGTIAQTLGWRKILWMSAILATVCEVLFLTCFRETYKVPILRRRAARQAEETGNLSFKTAVGAGDHRSLSKLWESIKRPARVISGSIVLPLLALYGGVGFSFFYFMAVTLPDILEGLYGMSPAAAGSSFMSFSRFTAHKPSPRVMSLTPTRRRIYLCHRLVREVPRQNLRQAQGQTRQQRPTRIPTPARHHRSVLPSIFRHGLRLDSPDAPPAACDALLCRHDGLHSAARVPASHGIRRGCIRSVLGVCPYERHCHSVLVRHLLAAHEWAGY